MSAQDSLLIKIISDLNIRITQLTLPVSVNRNFPDLGLRSTLFGEDAPFTDSFPEFDPNMKKQSIMMLKDQYRCNYFLGFNPDRTQIFLVGPYAHKVLTLAEMNHIFVKIGFEHPDFEYLREYYHSLPIIRDENLIYTILHAYCVKNYGPEGFELSYGEITPGKITAPLRNSSPEKTVFQRDFNERTYATEKLLLDCIAEGNHKGAESVLKRLEQQGVESRLTNTLRNFKNYAIVFNTLCRVAARDGGAPAWEIDRLSRSYSLQIENKDSAAELISLREEMLKNYCRIVREANSDTCSPMIQKAADIIHSDFAQHITLEKMAQELNVSAGYLSVLFSREMGCSFSEYLCRTRIKHAEYLLESSDLPVSVIAAECGIPDSNYFSRLFRQKENMTPLQYRRKTRQHK